MACLYLLWCSGDIEVHPGPCMKKKSLVHDSSIERRWIQNISLKIIIRLPELLQSKYTASKKVRNDRENKEHFKTLLKTCLEVNVHVPKMYQSEINAWETMEYKLLHKLFVYRCEIETIMTSLKDFLTFGGGTEDLTDINVRFDTELKTNEIAMDLGKYQRPKDKSQLMVYITRHIAGISIKCAHGKDPDVKCDGLWDLPLENWPKDIILFDPNNRGTYTIPGQKLIPDQELVDILLTIPQITIPQKYKDIVDAFKAMRKSKTKQKKAELCSIFKRTTSLEKLDYALKNLSDNGILTEEVHDILTKWWTTGAVETEYDKTQSLENMDDDNKKRRPHISINIGTEFITLAIEPTSKFSSKVSYNFPFNDELVPLKMMATSASQTTVQNPSNDFHHKITAKKNLTLSPLSDANPADNQTDSITIPQETMDILNSIINFDSSSQAIFESDIKLQCKTSTQDPASSSLTHVNQTISSTFQFSQSIQNIAISAQPVPILCTPHQSTTNPDDLGHLHSSDTNVSQNLNLYKQVSPTSDMGSSDSISSVNSEAGNEERDQNYTLNEGQDQLTDSDYSSDSSNNYVSKKSSKKRKCIKEHRNETKKRKQPSLKQDKKLTETNNSKIAPPMDKSTISNKNMELLLDHFDIDLDSFNIDEQTFDVKLNTIDNEDKNLQICDKDGNLMNGETQMSNENTKLSAYNINVSTELEKFLQDMINCEGGKMSHMKSYV
ncbi:uncharacterized protein LOC127718797 [Mytilus californianus]|uniref:uncharacterized protein LOC127718797 n=1 Tax=Mytilus californianus TaxID=6549 RepID=UPI0022461495|nr:uncharacterized protein LOC127718797 [Mytilus californianus]